MGVSTNYAYPEGSVSRSARIEATAIKAVAVQSATPEFSKLKI